MASSCVSVHLKTLQEGEQFLSLIYIIENEVWGCDLRKVIQQASGRTKIVQFLCVSPLGSC